MKQSLKTLILAASVAGLSSLLSACSSTGKVDYDDDLETPDVLLQDASGGESDFGLDKNAAQHNQQNKPDGLLQSSGSGSSASTAPQPVTEAQPHRETQTEAQPEPQVSERQVAEPQTQVANAPTVKKAEKAKKAKKVKKPRKEPTQKESALEVDDPLLGEIDPQ